MYFHVNPTSKEPIYRQIISQIKRGIATGKLPLGSKLPSVRELAKELLINPNTIFKIYTELERENLVYTKKGVGTFIAAMETSMTLRAKEEVIEEMLDPIMVEAVNLGMSGERLTKLLHKKLKTFKRERNR